MGDQYTIVLNKLLDGASLSEGEAYDLMLAMAREELTPSFSGAILAGLRAKGETADEIRGFARGMRDLAIRPIIPAGTPTLDTVGTGGDGSGSLNLSTGTGLLAAAAGIRVVKHGNRSISSKSGSADMLESIGMVLPVSENKAIKALNSLGFTFLFSPAFHPAMKAIMPVRNALGVRTVFNMLGPLSNPATPPYQLIGAFSKAAAKLMADTLSGLSIERAFVVHGAPAWDEATPIGEFVLYDVMPGKVIESIRQPEDYGVNRCTADELSGQDAAYNARALELVFNGEDKGAHRDALLMGVSLVLELMGKVEHPMDGMQAAATIIDNGAALNYLNNFKEYFDKSE